MIGGPIFGEQLVGAVSDLLVQLVVVASRVTVCVLLFGCTGVSLMKKLMLSFGDQGISQLPLLSAWWSTQQALGLGVIGSFFLLRHYLTQAMRLGTMNLQALHRQHKGGLLGCTDHPTMIIWSKCRCNPARQ